MIKTSALCRYWMPTGGPTKNDNRLGKMARLYKIWLDKDDGDYDDDIENNR